VSGFGPEHLPYGVFRRASEATRVESAARGGEAARAEGAAGARGGEAARAGVAARGRDEPRVGVRFGDGVLDLAALAADGLLDADPGLFVQPSLNAFMAAGPEIWRRVRGSLRALTSGPDAELAAVPLEEAELLLPIEVGDYVDFFSSIDHASNAGRMFRPDGDPLPSNWRHLPIGYHGRSGTVVVSGTPIRRPRGQRLEHGAPVYGPSTRLDIELELGFVVGVPSAHGEPVPVDAALDHLFGVVLLNDWSARDLQAWESRPLGPFLAKSFATSISSWVTPLDALISRRVPAGAQEPEPLPYLREEPWALDLDLEVELNGATVARTNARHLYWSAAQQLAHMTVNGASLRVGDLYGSGTISGPEREQRGSLLELSWNGTEPIALPDGSTRTFLEDGDEVVLRGHTGEVVTLGEVRGRIEPAG
jgi:fumarylacetoacetase